MRSYTLRIYRRLVRECQYSRVLKGKNLLEIKNTHRIGIPSLSKVLPLFCSAKFQRIVVQQLIVNSATLIPLFAVPFENLFNSLRGYGNPLHKTNLLRHKKNLKFLFFGVAKEGFYDGKKLHSLRTVKLGTIGQCSARHGKEQRNK